MCLCVLLHQEVPGYPVVMGANREEAYERPSLAPAWVGPGPGAFAGRDALAGGTWQGVNPFGLVVAVTNRVSGDLDPQRRSRGLLCLDVLRRPSAGAALHWAVEHLRGEPYNAHNLLIADARQAFALHYQDGPQVTELQPGLHILSDTDIDDPTHPRVERVKDVLDGRAWAGWAAARAGLEQLMADHAVGRPVAQQLCRHADVAGTVSSSLIALGVDRLEAAHFLFAPGSPCAHPYQDLSPLLRAGPP